jgi:hypothetical protein
MSNEPAENSYHLDAGRAENSRPSALSTETGLREAERGPVPGTVVVLLGLALVILNCYWVTVMEVRWYSLDGSSLPLFVTPIFFLFLLVVANAALSKVMGHRVFSARQLITIYVMLVISVVVSGHDTVQNLMGSIAYAYRNATPENRWPQFILPRLPSWLVISDPQAVKDYYEGGASLYRWQAIKVWLVPLAAWGFLFTAVFALLLFTNRIISRLWLEHERLAFPIIQLPLAMVAERGSEMWRSKLMWVGFIVAAGMTTMNNLHIMYPTLPYISLSVRDPVLNIAFKNLPWSAAGGLQFGFYLFAIGLAYFVPLDLLFSFWFFFLFAKFQRVVAAAQGWDAVPGFPYQPQQAAGAWIAIGLGLLWGMRGHLRRVIQMAMGKEGSAEDVNSYRKILAGAAISLALVCAFLRAMGIPLWLGLAFFALFLLLSLCIAHVRAQLGAPHEISSGDIPVHPQGILQTLAGTKPFGPQAVASMGLMWWMHRGYRNHPMPNQLEAFKMGGDVGLRPSNLAWIMLLACVVAFAAAAWANLHVCYAEGAEVKVIGNKRWVGNETFTRMLNWLEVGETPDKVKIGAMASACAFVFFLSAMRARYIWWVFHPTGYALGISWASTYFWSSFLVAWVIKLALIRYGGMKLHRAAMPLFLGLILGQYVAGATWAIIGPAMGFRNYRFYI